MDNTTTTTINPNSDLLTVVKNSLGLIDDTDDQLIQDYLDSAKQYILKQVDDDSISSDPRFTVAQIELATYYYEQRGNADQPTDALPFGIQSLINNLIYNN